jgi:hypothetical protein
MNIFRGYCSSMSNDFSPAAGPASTNGNLPCIPFLFYSSGSLAINNWAYKPEPVEAEVTGGANMKEPGNFEPLFTPVKNFAYHESCSGYYQFENLSENIFVYINTVD